MNHLENQNPSENYKKIDYDATIRASKHRESSHDERMSKKSNDDLFSKWKKQKKLGDSKEEELDMA